MTDRPRWEGDPLGRGEASAAAVLPALHELAARAADEGWVAEDPEMHLGGALRAWLSAGPARPWAEVTLATDGPWLLVRAAWTGDGRLGELRADAYALLGSFAEVETFVRQRSDPGARLVVFECATGLTGEVFAPHGHLVRLEVRGPVAERVADEHARMRDTAPR